MCYSRRCVARKKFKVSHTTAALQLTQDTNIGSVRSLITRILGQMDSAKRMRIHYKRSQKWTLAFSMYLTVRCGMNTIRNNANPGFKRTPGACWCPINTYDRDSFSHEYTTCTTLLSPSSFSNRRWHERIASKEMVFMQKKIRKSHGLPLQEDLRHYSFFFVTSFA